MLTEMSRPKELIWLSAVCSFRPLAPREKKTVSQPRILLRCGEKQVLMKCGLSRTGERVSIHLGIILEGPASS